MTNLLIGGAAGDGIETMAGMLEKILHEEGFSLFSMRDFMSRVRGGHNFAQIRFGRKPVLAHRDGLNLLVVFNEESLALHENNLAKDGLVLYDEALPIKRENALPLAVGRLAKETGNPKTAGTVYLGALVRLLGLDADRAGEVLKKNLPVALLEANLAALDLGYGAVETRMRVKRPKEPSGAMLLTGADAMAMGALAGGLRFYSAYPMSPSTTLLAFFQKHQQAFCLGVEQAEDEIAAVNMAIGAAYAGAPAMAGTSGGGFSLMVEALGFAGIAEIPLVLANVMRPGPSTGLPTRTEQSDLDFAIHASQGEFPRMVIALRDPADAFRQTARAFRLAWQYQMPVILLSDQFLADSAVTIPPLNAEGAGQSAALPAGAKARGKGYNRYALAEIGVSPLRIPGQSAAIVRIDSDEHDETGVITESAAVRIAQMDKRLAKMQSLKGELQEPAYHGPAKPEILLVGFGSTANAMREAVGRWNKTQTTKAGALCFGDVWPLPAKRLTHYAKNAKKIVGVEQNATGQLAGLLRREAGLEGNGAILKYDGRQMSVDDILAGMRRLRLQEG